MVRPVFQLLVPVALVALICNSLVAQETDSPARALSGPEPARKEQPNVVLILSDDQGWGDIGYNNPKVYSPNLDRLAGEGLTFRNNYVMPQCTPTRVALMTGRFPSRFGGAALQASNDPAFPIGTPTIAAMLQDAGYETFLCGKWHLGSTFEHGPNHFGFDHSYGALTGAIGMYDHRYRKGEFCETWHRNHELIEGLENGEHATDLVTREAIRIIEAEREKPFFLYVPFFSVHTPLDERGEFTDTPTRLDPENEQRWMNEDRIGWFKDPDGKIQAETDPEKRLFLATVHHMDHCVGEIVQALERTGQRENTLILFSSDNGPQVNWGGDAYPDDLKLTDFNQPVPFRGKKIDVWEGGICVPGFANWPGKIESRESDAVVHIVDWMPTLASVCDAAVPDTALDGTDLSGLMLRNEEIGERLLYWTWNKKINRRALRKGDWKIVNYGSDSPQSADAWQLFQLTEDAAESTDVSGEYPEVRERLHGLFLEQQALDAGSGR